MAWITGRRASGSGTATVTCPTGSQLHVRYVSGWFETTGPATGTLQLFEGTSTVVWEASVSGGLAFTFPDGQGFAITAETDAKLSLTSGKVLLTAGEYDAP